jgi:predicted Zn-dependent protease
MKRAAVPLLSLVLGALLLGAGHRSATATGTTDAATIHESDGGSIGGALGIAGPVRPGENREAVKRKLHDEEGGTYIDEILLERDSSLARWPDRDAPLSIWIRPQSNIAGFDTTYVGRVKAAFRAWDDVDLPIHFQFIADSARADVHVTWIDHFKDPISGRTRWTRDEDWNITNADIVLAVHHRGGEQLDPDAMRAMAMHEIGHLLGLDHTTDSSSIMAPVVRVRELSMEDRATAQLLYSLPAGPLR